MKETPKQNINLNLSDHVPITDHITLDLIHAHDASGPLKLFVFNEQGFHDGGQWFNHAQADELKCRAHVAMDKGLEVRIMNWADFLVFHAEHGNVIWPQDESAFWADVREQGDE